MSDKEPPPQSIFPYSVAQRVSFFDGDPAGISFFANVYRWHHQAYEAFVTQYLGFEYHFWFQNTEFGIPLRRSEAEYYTPIFPGSSIEIHIRVSKLGTTSFTLESEIHSIHDSGASRETLCAKVLTQHVFIDLKSKAKMEIPSPIRKAMNERASVT